MRFIQIGVLYLLLAFSLYAQAANEVFGLRGQLSLTGKDEAIDYHISLNNGGSLLLIGRNQLQLWDVADGRLIGSSPHRITGFWVGSLGISRNMEKLLTGIEVSPDGRKGILAAKIVGEKGTKERTAVVWDLETGDKLAVLKRPLGPLRDAAYSSNGSTIMTVQGDLKASELSFWNASDHTHRGAIPVSDLSYYQMTGDGGHVYIGSARVNKFAGIGITGFESSNGIELWNTRTLKLEKTFTDEDVKFWGMYNSGPILSGNEKYLAARNESNKIIVWGTAGDGTPKYRLGDGDLKKRFKLIGISDDSRYLLTQRNNEGLVYELESGKLYRRFPMRDIESYTLSADSRYAIRRSLGWVGLYDLEKEKPGFEHDLEVADNDEDNPSYEFEVEKPQLSPDMKLMMIRGGNAVRLFDVETGRLVQTLVDSQRVKYYDGGFVKRSGLDNHSAGWLAGGDSVYVLAEDRRSVFLWTKK